MIWVILYKISMRVHRYYLKLFSYILDLCICNAWVLYKYDCCKSLEVAQPHLWQSSEWIVPLVPGARNTLKGHKTMPLQGVYSTTQLCTERKCQVWKDAKMLRGSISPNTCVKPTSTVCIRDQFTGLTGFVKHVKLHWVYQTNETAFLPSARPGNLHIRLPKRYTKA